MLDPSRIAQICQDNAFHDFRVGSEIPEKKLRNARESFPIPPEETVFALFDATVFGSNKEGFAIGGAGVYWKNASFARSANSFLPWREISHTEAEVVEKDNVLDLGGGNRIYLSLKDQQAGALALFNELRDAAAEVFAPGSHEHTAVEELRRVCGAHIGKYRVFVGREIPEKKLAVARQHLGIDPMTPVLALIDAVPFGKDDLAMVVTEDGLHWRNPAEQAQGHQDSPLLWEDLAECPEPRARGRDTIEFDADAWFVVSAERRDDALALLRDLWRWAADEFAEDHHDADEDHDAAGEDHAPAAAAPAPPPAPGAAPPPPPPAPQRWMLARDGQTFGPYDTATVETMLKAGQVDPATAHAWTEGMPQWLPFRQVPALALLEPSAATPPPPPPFSSTPPPPPGATAVSVPPTVNDGRVDVNRASEDELLALPGITAERARRIVERRATGGFASAAELGAFLGLAPHEVQALAAEAAFGAVAPAQPSAPQQPSAPAPGRVVDF